MWRLIIFLTVVTVFASARRSDAVVDHSPWDALLKRYVDDNGRVAYRDLQARDRATFERYLTTLAQAQIEGMTEAEEKALWINAYNAAIVSAILQGYSAENILARKQLFSWYTVPIAGKERSPEQIEHQILRKEFHDPRIHFAIVCASTSCPKLRREAYVAEHLDQQLEEAARVFINDPTRNRIDPQHLSLSMIFRWFAEDFVRSAASVLEFVRQYVDDGKKAILAAKKDDIQYLEYDWTLNAQDGQRVS